MLDAETLPQLRKAAADVTVEEPMLDYIAKIVRKTRENRNLVLGAPLAPQSACCWGPRPSR